MSSRLFLIAIIATVLTFFLISTEAKSNKEGSRASRAILNKRKSKSSSSDGDFSGTATWFVPSSEDGSTGACGPEEDDDAYIVALNTEQYGDMSSKSNRCGESVRIAHKGKSVEAVINDACPECAYGDLDLTKPVFAELGDFDTGILDITWEII